MKFIILLDRFVAENFIVATILLRLMHMRLLVVFGWSVWKFGERFAVSMLIAIFISFRVDAIKMGKWYHHTHTSTRQPMFHKMDKWAHKTRNTKCWAEQYFTFNMIAWFATLAKAYPFSLQQNLFLSCFLISCLSNLPPTLLHPHRVYTLWAVRWSKAHAKYDVFFFHSFSLPSSKRVLNVYGKSPRTFSL